MGALVRDAVGVRLSLRDAFWGMLLKGIMEGEEKMRAIPGKVFCDE